MFALLFVPVSPESIGIYPNADWRRSLYPFFHASFLHWLLNMVAFLEIVFYTKIRLHYILFSYFIAISYFPDNPFDRGLPTIGFSGVVFAMLGSVCFHMKFRPMFVLGIVFPLLLGFLFPCVNAALHAYCYIAGWMVGLLLYSGDDDKWC